MNRPLNSPASDTVPLNILEDFHRNCVVFLHVVKTAGTSLNLAVQPQFPKNRVFDGFEKGRLECYSLDQLASYDYFHGHFRYSDLIVIPRSTKFVFTFLREPIERLISFYRYARSHPPGHKSMEDPIFKLASELEVEDFFAHEIVRVSTWINNHYVHVFGAPIFSTWEESVGRGADASSHLDSARKAIEAMNFVGFVDRFEADQTRLCQLLGLDTPIFQIRVNETSRVKETNSQFRQVDEIVVNQRLHQILQPLVRHDIELFNLARAVSEINPE